MKDPIVEEVRQSREKHAKKFNNDLHEICRDLKKLQKACGHKIVNCSPKKILNTLQK